MSLLYANALFILGLPILNKLQKYSITESPLVVVGKNVHLFYFNNHETDTHEHFINQTNRCNYSPITFLL